MEEIIKQLNLPATATEADVKAAIEKLQKAKTPAKASDKDEKLEALQSLVEEMPVKAIGEGLLITHDGSKFALSAESQAKAHAKRIYSKVYLLKVVDNKVKVTAK